MMHDLAEGTICWRLGLSSPAEKVHSLLATAEGRARFWAEKAPETGGAICFEFLDGTREVSPVLRSDPPTRFELVYFGLETRFTITPRPDGGCDLEVRVDNVLPEDRVEIAAGWVSVLMALKAACDFGIDLRTHDPERSWRQAFVNQ